MIPGEQMEFACWNQWEELYLEGPGLFGLFCTYHGGAIPSFLALPLHTSLWEEPSPRLFCLPVESPSQNPFVL